MAYSDDRRYDSDSYEALHITKLPRIGTFNGTIAAAAILSRFKVPYHVKGEIVGYSETIGIGGTVAAAGPKLTLGRSLAGTGTVEPLATISHAGTQANQAAAYGTVTSVGTFIAGDEVRVSSVAGTADVQFTEIEMYLVWKERY